MDESERINRHITIGRTHDKGRPVGYEIARPLYIIIPEMGVGDWLNRSSEDECFGQEIYRSESVGECVKEVDGGQNLGSKLVRTFHLGYRTTDESKRRSPLTDDLWTSSLLVSQNKARLARIRIAKASSGAAFVSKKKAAEARLAAQESGLQLDENYKEEDIFELQHHHLLRCLEKTTSIAKRTRLPLAIVNWVRVRKGQIKEIEGKEQLSLQSAVTNKCRVSATDKVQ
uniref:Potassium channel voltage dependent Kv4 C-terminal domain-containing protein n=1 Tax=Vespula pensylvanica TaxID=30213 RepID=A0A834UAD5_VESPE|nr:hypothetical protein H0235_008014 [Vespula pensylvanica]